MKRRRQPTTAPSPTRRGSLSRHGRMTQKELPRPSSLSKSTSPPSSFANSLTIDSPKPGPGKFAGQSFAVEHFAALPELLENDRLVLFGDSNAGIADQQLEFARFPDPKHVR